jgi:acetyl esterase
MPLDSQVQRLLQAAAADGVPPTHTLSPEAARAAPRLGAAPDLPLEPVASVVSRTIPGPGGPLTLRIYTPHGAGPFPILLHIHGGGWVLCDLDTHDRECHALCRQSGYVVVAVDYRRAPEHKFPAAVYDCFSAASWTFEHATELNGHRRRVVVGGDSAGGNLSIATALLMRDAGLGRFAGLLLIYPVTDYCSPGTPSYTMYADGYGLTRDSMIWFWNHYLADPDAAAHPLASPLRAADLRDLPPAFVQLAECDVLHDEGERFGRCLEAAGVPTRTMCYAGMIHGFVNMSAVLDGGRRALADAADWLRQLHEAQTT